MRNEIFKVMFSKSFIEANQKTVTLHDFEYDIIFNFINFLYTDECEITQNNVVALLACCHHYRESVLQSRCENFISSSITIDNVCNIYIIASQYNCLNLKVQCTHFISYRYNQICITKEFESLAYEDRQILAKLRKLPIYREIG